MALGVHLQLFCFTMRAAQGGSVSCLVLGRKHVAENVFSFMHDVCHLVYFDVFMKYK